MKLIHSYPVWLPQTQTWIITRLSNCIGLAWNLMWCVNAPRVWISL